MLCTMRVAGQAEHMCNFLHARAQACGRHWQEVRHIGTDLPCKKIALAPGHCLSERLHVSLHHGRMRSGVEVTQQRLPAWCCGAKHEMAHCKLADASSLVAHAVALTHRDDSHVHSKHDVVKWVVLHSTIRCDHHVRSSHRGQCDSMTHAIPNTLASRQQQCGHDTRKRTRMRWTRWRF